MTQPDDGLYKANEKAVLFLPPNTVEASALKQIDPNWSLALGTLVEGD